MWTSQYTNTSPAYTTEIIQLVTDDLNTAISKLLDYCDFNTDKVAVGEWIMRTAPHVPIYHARGNALQAFFKQPWRADSRFNLSY
jgi:hypothetical protein